MAGGIRALAGPAPAGGLWTCRKVAAWMAGALGRPVAEVRGWEWMRRLGVTPQRPRPNVPAPARPAPIRRPKRPSKKGAPSPG